MTKEEFIQMILPAAMEGYKRYKILPSTQTEHWKADGAKAIYSTTCLA